MMFDQKAFDDGKKSVRDAALRKAQTPEKRITSLNPNFLWKKQNMVKTSP